MKVAWIVLGGAVSAAVLALLISASVEAADATTGVTTVAADELDKRSKQAEESQGGESKGMSDSAVRVLMTYAFSIIPEETPGPDGKPVKVDKSDPNKYLIPTDDARRVIRAATRTAYAEVCGVPDLGRANFEALMKGEEARKWTADQLQLINALHMFSVSYFTGNIKITAQEQPDEGGADAGAANVAKGAPPPPADDAAATRVITSEAPKCPPEQKQKVVNSINAYVQAEQAGE
ncbi:MAG: hypothetical protein ACRECX_12355 [Methyloceanibacter sp.]|uniref:hypothetical protein n=1 Tax=Methyloceanibacter sp. TaxID=1965321 RepID=UPI003D6D90FF